MEALYLTLYLLLLPVARALLQCPNAVDAPTVPSADGQLDSPAVLPQDGADGNFYIPGDFVLSQTRLSPNETYIAINFTLISAYDKTSLPCHAADTFADPNNYELAGTCDYSADGVMGNTSTTFTYIPEENQDGPHMLNLAQNFSCIFNSQSRFYRAVCSTEGTDIQLECDRSGSLCVMDQRVSAELDCVMYSPPPLTNCAAASRQNPTWTVPNVTYFSYSSASPFGIGFELVGAVFADVAMPNIDFGMSCDPESPMLVPNNTNVVDLFDDSYPWYDCRQDFSNPPDTPPTWIMFNQSTWEVSLNQSWLCDGDDPAHPINFTGVGSVVVPHACNRDISQPGISDDGLECWSTAVGIISPNVSWVTM